MKDAPSPASPQSSTVDAGGRARPAVLLLRE
jgi:hypothetical protein